MKDLWQDLLESIWPSRYDPIASHKHRVAVLEVLLAVAISVAAGPEVVAAMEMTALMELLGGVLFITAMGAGARLLALNVWDATCRFLVPVPLTFIVRPSASLPSKALAYVYLAAIAVWNLVLILECRPMVSLHPAGYTA